MKTPSETDNELLDAFLKFARENKEWLEENLKPLINYAPLPQRSSKPSLTE